MRQTPTFTQTPPTSYITPISHIPLTHVYTVEHKLGLPITDSLQPNIALPKRHLVHCDLEIAETMQVPLFSKSCTKTWLVQ